MMEIGRVPADIDADHRTHMIKMHNSAAHYQMAVLYSALPLVCRFRWLPVTWSRDVTCFGLYFSFLAAFSILLLFSINFFKIIAIFNFNYFFKIVIHFFKKYYYF